MLTVGCYLQGSSKLIISEASVPHIAKVEADQEIDEQMIQALDVEPTSQPEQEELPQAE